MQTADYWPGVTEIQTVCKFRLRVKRRLGTKCRMKTVDILNICAPSSPNRWNSYNCSWYQLRNSLPSRSTLHIRQKFQWTSKQLKSGYLDLQYFHRKSSKFPAEHLFLLLKWFTPFFCRHNSSCTVFWVISFYLSIHVVVLYQFAVTRIEKLASKVDAWGLSVEKKTFKVAIMFLGSSTTFQRRKEWICESRCLQVSVRLHAFAGVFFLPLNPSTTSVYARSAFYPSLRFTLSLQSAFYTQSAF